MDFSLSRSGISATSESQETSCMDEEETESLFKDVEGEDVFPEEQSDVAGRGKEQEAESKGSLCDRMFRNVCNSVGYCVLQN